jgi:hypothetical protein
MIRRSTFLLLAAVLASGVSFFAQATAPAMSFDANADLLKMPNDMFLGPVGGVAANSKGQIFVYTRTGHPYATLGDNRTFAHGGSRLFQFDQNGKFVRELGPGRVRVQRRHRPARRSAGQRLGDRRGANQVIKFDSEGRVVLVLGRKPEAILRAPARRPVEPDPEAVVRQPQDAQPWWR